MDILLRHVDPYNITPLEDVEYHYGAQIHTSSTCHADLRFEFGTKDVVNGITLAVSQEGIKLPTSILELQKLIQDPTNWKMNLQTGEIQQKRFRNNILTEAYLFMHDRKRDTKDWLFRDNDTIPAGSYGATPTSHGLVALFDKGVVEYGFQYLYNHEIFLHGRVFNGRYIFRILQQPPQNRSLFISNSASDSLSDLVWILIKPTDQTPAVLSLKIIQEKKLPPFGISALPKALRRKVPSMLRYWLISNKEQAHQARINLRQFFIDNNIIEGTLGDDADWHFHKSILEKQVFEMNIPSGYYMTDKEGTQTFHLYDPDLVSKVKVNELTDESFLFFIKCLHQVPSKMLTFSEIHFKRLNVEQGTSLVKFDGDKLIVSSTGIKRFNYMLVPLLYHTVAYHFAKENPLLFSSFTKTSEQEGGYTPLAKQFEGNKELYAINFAEMFRLWRSFKLRRVMECSHTFNNFLTLLN